MKTPLRVAALSALLLSGMAHAAEPLTIDVHRDANCGCCKTWFIHVLAGRCALSMGPRMLPRPWVLTRPGTNS